MKTEPQKPLVLCFHVHQPRRLRRLTFLDVGNGYDYFNDYQNEEVIRTAAARCYLPVNALLTKLCKEVKGVKISFAISGLALAQFEKFAPEVLQSFKTLVDTGCVELLGETSHNSLASIMPNDEFPNQVKEHSNMLQHYFNVRPTVFRNTELIYNNNIGSRVAQLGFKGILCDDVDRILMNNNRHSVYRHPSDKNLKILLRNNTLSDDIGFRYITGTGTLEVDRYFKALEISPGIVTLGLDYETFGEHQPESTGILTFLEQLIIKATESEHLKLMTPSEALNSTKNADKLDVPEFTSCADSTKNLTAWLDNDMQNEAFMAVTSLEEQVTKSGNSNLIDTWRNLQTSEHFYYMSTKTSSDGEVHSYYSPYNSPYEAYINYMNILNDFKLRLQQSQPGDAVETTEYERRHEHVPVWAEKAQAEYHEITSR